MNSQQQQLIDWLENTVKLDIADYTTPQQFRQKIQELITFNICLLKNSLPKDAHEMINSNTTLYLRLLDTDSVYHYLKRKNSPNVLVRLLNKLFFQALWILQN